MSFSSIHLLNCFIDIIYSSCYTHGSFYVSTLMSSTTAVESHGLKWCCHYHKLYYQSSINTLGQLFHTAPSSICSNSKITLTIGGIAQLAI